MRFLLAVYLVVSASACVFMPGSARDLTDNARPASVEEYYKSGTYGAIDRETLREVSDCVLERVHLESSAGDITIDYFRRPEPGDSLILVFPILGGRNNFANYFAEYFAKRGFETAVIHRDGNFKNPDYFYELEELFRNNVVKDRIAMDFFEQEHGKRRFASFGISRGGINVAITAGVDERLKYNVIAMGGEDLVNMFRDSEENGIDRFRQRVMKKHNITEVEFFDFLKKNIRTDPKNVAMYIDAKDTLMILSAFDRSVPIKYGMQLRETIGHPDTIFLASGHYSSVAFTRFVPLVPPATPVGVFPMNYIETEAMAFYEKKLGKGRSVQHWPYRLIQLPFSLIGRIGEILFSR